jgi:cysteine desulfurase
MNLSSRTYLDRAAGASGNPSSPHEEGRRAKKILEDARTTIARLIEVQPDDVVFTSGATEANALAIIGHVRALRAAGGKDMHVLYLPSSHASVVENVKSLAAEGVAVEALPIVNYRVDIEALKKMIRPSTGLGTREETVLVSMDAVCGETGVVWNTREVAEVLRKFRTGILKKESARAARPIQLSFFNMPALHVDASQAPLTEKISRAHFGADMLSFDASKVGMTRGVGALVAHRTIPILPLYKGGGQERGLCPGSEAFKLAKNFASDLKTAVAGRESFRASAERERAQLIKFIKDTIPNVYINEGHEQVPHILNISLPGRDTDYLVALLDEAGFAVSTRSACETDSEDSSRAVFALTGDKAPARATLRISWGPNISPRQFVRFGKVLAREVALLAVS